MRTLVIVLLSVCLRYDTYITALYSDTMPVGVLLRDRQKFDYIVVGSGAGGSAAASRLALAGADVLLVEAGGDPNVFSKVPSATMGLLGSDIDWQYRTLPNNKSCLSSLGQQCRFSRGRCLGGSTSINYMLYTRGNKKDFEDIPVTGWSWDDLFPYFLKYEGLQDLDLLPASSKPYHNTTGTMRIEFFHDPENPWHARLKKSYKALGFPWNPDVNAESQIGVNQAIGYVYKGERMSTARGYLAREDVKSALKVAKNTFCTKVIIDKTNVARGIKVIQGLLKLRIYARKEVILSAGAIGTPQILMLSGIGPADHLQTIGIGVKVNLPAVGANMTDHTLPLMLALVDRSTSIADELKALVTFKSQLAQLLIERSGPLSSNGITDVHVFANSHCYNFEQRRLLNSSTDGSDCEIPNLQIIHAYVDRNLLPLAKPLFQHAIGLDDNVVDQMSKANEEYGIIIISPILLSPYSKGHVRLASSDPLTPPEIFPNYLGDERDVDELTRFVGIVEQLMKTKSFRKRKATLLHLRIPGCPEFEEDRQNYWRCYCRHMTFAVYHAAGTCPLGGAVDARLRVHGVQRLRVADLSVLPRVPRGNTAAVTIAIGERVADFILEDRSRYTTML